MLGYSTIVTLSSVIVAPWTIRLRKAPKHVSCKSGGVYQDLISSTEIAQVVVEAKLKLRDASEAKWQSTRVACKSSFSKGDSSLGSFCKVSLHACQSQLFCQATG